MLRYSVIWTNNNLAASFCWGKAQRDVPSYQLRRINCDDTLWISIRKARQIIMQSNTGTINNCLPCLHIDIHYHCIAHSIWSSCILLWGRVSYQYRQTTVVQTVAVSNVKSELNFRSPDLHYDDSPLINSKFCMVAFALDLGTSPGHSFYHVLLSRI